MKLLYTYVPFQVLLGVFLGILYPLNKHLVLVGCFSILLGLLYYRLGRHYLFLVFVVVLGYVIGGFSVLINNELNYPSHYCSHIEHQQSLIRLTLTKQLKSSLKTNRFYATVNAVDTVPTSGSILVQIPKSKKQEVGDVLLGVSTIKKNNKPSSPYNFNYQQYLHRRQVYGVVYFKHFIELKQDSHLIYKIQNLRERVEKAILTSRMSFKTQSLVIAMLLGDKEYLTSDVKQSFINSGVVHLIAISGMHVGVLYLLLYHLFSFLTFFKYGHYYRVFVVLMLLLSFAIFSGLSSSVARSVTMFGFILLARLKRNRGLLLEPIISSALLLLIFNPNYLYDAGFQLSYLAVISIVVFYPLVMNYFAIKNKIVKYFVDVLVVSVIAQLGVLAISLYYFQQFSFQFLGANFFAVSLLPLVLYGGVLVLLKILLFPQIILLEHYYDIFIQWYLSTIDFFSSMESLLIKEIHVTRIQVLCYYIFLWMIWLIYKRKKFVYVLTTLVFLFFIQLNHISQRFKIMHKQELIIYNSSKSTLISIKDKNKLILLNGAYDKKIIAKNRISNRVHKVIVKNNEVFNFNQETYLVIKANIDYRALGIKNAVIILENNPLINLERVMLDISSQKVIICKNNYQNNIIKWKSTCEKLQVPLYDIDKEGAYLKTL
ncbi:ComEC/Rec2 family competence protein [Wenyingzhuangia sp. IMCC45533]